MSFIRDITVETSGDTIGITSSIGKLTELCNELHEAVADFQLSEEDTKLLDTNVQANSDA